MKLEAQEYCDLVSELSKSRKSEACSLNSGMTDTTSFVSVWYSNELMAVEATGDGNPVELLPETLDRVIKSGVMKFDALAFTAEVFMKPIDHLSDEDKQKLAERYKSGDLEKEYKSSPITDIVEGLFTVAITWEGETAYRFVEVKYDDRGQPVYGGDEGEVSAPQRSMSGMVARILGDYRDYCRRELATDGGREYLEAFDELVKEQGSLERAVAYIANLDREKN